MLKGLKEVGLTCYQTLTFVGACHGEVEGKIKAAGKQGSGKLYNNTMLENEKNIL